MAVRGVRSSCETSVEKRRICSKELVQPRRHPVEAVDQVIELIAGAAQRNLQGKIRAGDVLRRLRHRVDRLKRAARDHPAQQAGQRDQSQQGKKIVIG